jgi:hypothetical protein
LNSKANATITLADSDGNVLAADDGFDGSDPLLVYTFPKSGPYNVRISELMLGGSVEHFYRLSIGPFPYVTSYFPLSVGANRETEAELIGYNLQPGAKVRIKAEKPGEIDLPINPDEFRTRRTFKVLVGEAGEMVEAEPNDQPSEATSVGVPGAVNGRLWAADKSKSADVDLFRLKAKAETW